MSFDPLKSLDNNLKGQKLLGAIIYRNAMGQLLFTFNPKPFDVFSFIHVFS